MLKVVNSSSFKPFKSLPVADSAARMLERITGEPCYVKTVAYQRHIILRQVSENVLEAC